MNSPQYLSDESSFCEYIGTLKEKEKGEIVEDSSTGDLIILNYYIGCAKLITWTKNIIELFNDALMLSKHSTYRLCSPFPHISQKGVTGHGWSCGYRNIQMLCASLLQLPCYKRILFGGSGELPTVIELQTWIERAWADGFDVEVTSFV